MQPTGTTDLPDDLPRDYRLREGLGFQLSRVARQLQERLDSGLAEAGLTRLKWCVLEGIALEGRRAPSDLAAHIGVTRPVVSRLLSDLGAEGLIARGIDSADARGRALSVTAAGIDRLRRAWPAVRDHQRRVEARLSPEDHAALRTLLARLAGDDSPRLTGL